MPPSAESPEPDPPGPTVGAALRRISRHSLIYGGAEQLGRLGGLLLTPIITSPGIGLAEGDFGTRELLTVTLLLLTQLAGRNLGTGLTRFYFDARPEDRRRVASTVVLGVAGLAAVVALVLGALAPQVAALLPSDRLDLPRLLRLTMGILFFQLVRDVQNQYLQTQMRSVTFGTIALAKVVVEVTLQIVFLAALHRGLPGLFEAVLISEALFACVVSLIVLPEIGLGFAPAILGPIVAYALPLLPNGLLQFFLHSADRYMLGWLRDTDAVGLYALAYKAGYLPNSLVLGPFLLIWYPFVFSVKDGDAQRRVVGRVASYFMLAMTATTLVLALYARELVEFLGRRASYHVAWPAVLPIALGYWLWALFQILQTGFFVMKKTRPLPWMTAAAVVLNVALNLIAIPRFGIWGAAAATALTFAGLAALTWERVRGLFDVRYEWRRILLPLLGAAGAVAAGLAGPAGVPVPSPIWRAAWAGLWLVWIVWAGGFFRVEERRTAREAIGRLLSR